jgi:hypothetical protein
MLREVNSDKKGDKTVTTKVRMEGKPGTTLIKKK